MLMITIIIMIIIIIIMIIIINIRNGHKRENEEKTFHEESETKI